MLALRWDGSRARVEDVPPPEPAAGFAVVDVTLAGVCNTDLEIVRGYMGFRGTLGHELVGRVARGPASWQGARVVAEINFACGACEACARGLGRHCATRAVMGILGADGAIAEQVAVPVVNLHRVPDGVSDEAAVFAEPLAAAFEILEQVEIDARTRALVLGDGKLGQLVARVLAGAGARVTVVGKHAEKLALLGAACVEVVLSPGAYGSGFGVVIEATGTAAGLEAAIAATRPRGTLVLKSTVAGKASVDLAPVVIHEITLVGSRCGPFAPALAALASRAVDVAPLVSARLALRQADEALRRAGASGVLKVLVAP
ncbi:MAG TPA: alcohol dehydrogenase catalytic domain-containing protein [Byssovorax sp.]|jgi:threonine dehydrogenase-like Zn-dependent dehydrogenase